MVVKVSVKTYVVACRLEVLANSDNEARNMALEEISLSKNKLRTCIIRDDDKFGGNKDFSTQYGNDIALILPDDLRVINDDLIIVLNELKSHGMDEQLAVDLINKITSRLNPIS
jgi:predicted small metal-binding protein